MATKAELEARLAEYETIIDDETLALQRVVSAIEPFAPKSYYATEANRRRRQQAGRILAQAAQRFDLHVYSEE